MTRWATFIIALLFVGALHYADTAAGQDGWVALFDGKNLDQWDAAATPEVSYSIEDR
jgi:hypothetical protein